MSIKIEDVYVKTTSLGSPEVIIGDSYLSMSAFCSIVKYVLTNTDLQTLEDPRVDLIETMKSYTYLPGYNKGTLRYGL